MSIEHLYHRVLELGATPLDYADKMITDVPDTEVIDRQTFVLNRCMDKVVLDIGCAGPFHKDLRDITKKCYGIDQTMVKDDPLFTQIVIGKEPIPIYDDIQIVFCGEVIEHLSNPGLFLDEIKVGYPNVEKIVTVPNAFGRMHGGWMKKQQECTNKDHVAFYSYVTITNLLQRHGYEVKEFYWYDNPEYIEHQGLNEGMVVVAI